MTKVYPCNYCGDMFLDYDEQFHHECSYKKENTDFVGKCFKIIGYDEIFKVVDTIKDDKGRITHYHIEGISWKNNYLHSEIKVATDQPFCTLYYGYEEISQEEYDTIIKEQVMKHFGKYVELKK